MKKSVQKKKRWIFWRAENHVPLPDENVAALRPCVTAFAILKDQVIYLNIMKVAWHAKPSIRAHQPLSISQYVSTRRSFLSFGNTRHTPLRNKSVGPTFHKLEWDPLYLSIPSRKFSSHSPASASSPLFLKHRLKIWEEEKAKQTAIVESLEDIDLSLLLDDGKTLSAKGKKGKVTPFEVLLSCKEGMYGYLFFLTFTFLCQIKFTLSPAQLFQKDT